MASPISVPRNPRWIQVAILLFIASDFQLSRNHWAVDALEICISGECFPPHRDTDFHDADSDINTVSIAPIRPQKLLLPRYGTYIALLSDWDTQEVKRNQESLSPQMMEFAKDVTVTVSHKDGITPTYHFLHRVASNYPFLHFIVMIQLSFLSPAVGHLIIHEASLLPNVKLLSAGRHNENLYTTKHIMAEFVETPYTLVSMFDKPLKLLWHYTLCIRLLSP